MEGIFEITNTKNKMKYYGYAQDCYLGFEQAIKNIPALHEDVEYYGIKAFYFKVLLECDYPDIDNRRRILKKYINNGIDFSGCEGYNTYDLKQEMELSYNTKNSIIINKDCLQCLKDKTVALIQEEVCELIPIYHYLAKNHQTLSKTTYSKEVFIDYVLHRAKFFELDIIYNYLSWWKEHANKPIALPTKVYTFSEPQKKRYLELKKAVEQYNDVIAGKYTLANEEHLYGWRVEHGVFVIDIANKTLNTQGTLTRFFQNSSDDMNIMSHFYTKNIAKLQMENGIQLNNYYKGPNWIMIV